MKTYAHKITLLVGVTLLVLMLTAAHADAAYRVTILKPEGDNPQFAAGTPINFVVDARDVNLPGDPVKRPVKIAYYINSVLRETQTLGINERQGNFSWTSDPEEVPTTATQYTFRAEATFLDGTKESAYFPFTLYGGRLGKAEDDGTGGGGAGSGTSSTGTGPDLGVCLDYKFGIFPYVNIGPCILDVISWTFAIIITFLGWIVNLASLILDTAINMSVVRFKDWADLTVKGWKVARDAANIAFIFVLLYIAIGTILRLGGVETKKMVARVIIIALLINFSFAFTQMIIDASNVTAIQFYAAVKGEKDQPIGNRLMERLDPQRTLAEQGGVVENTSATQAALRGINNWKIIWVGGGIILLFLVTTFVLLAGAVLFALRTVELVFILLLSPLAFAGMMLPKSGGYSSEWWKKLFDNAIFAPAFMFMVFLSFSIIPDINQYKNKDTPEMILMYIIIIGLMLGSIIIAKRMGAAGSGTVTKWGDRAKGAALGAMRGATGGTARTILGGGAARLANTRLFRGLAASESGWAKWTGARALARQGTKGLDAVSEAKFGTKKGYVEKQKEKRETIVKFGQRLGKDTVTGEISHPEYTDPEYTDQFQESLPGRSAAGRFFARFRPGGAAKVGARAALGREVLKTRHREAARGDLDTRIGNTVAAIQRSQQAGVAVGHPDFLTAKERLDLENTLAQMRSQLAQMEQSEDLERTIRSSGGTRQQGGAGQAGGGGQNP